MCTSDPLIAHLLEHVRENDIWLHGKLPQHLEGEVGESHFRYRGLKGHRISHTEACVLATVKNAARHS